MSSCCSFGWAIFMKLTLTGKECGLEERAPMCGIPYHSSENYIAKLVKKGYKVAICEQMEDPATAKGLVKREIIRVITPGTVLESNMLDAGANNLPRTGQGSVWTCLFGRLHRRGVRAAGPLRLEKEGDQ